MLLNVLPPDRLITVPLLAMPLWRVLLAGGCNRWSLRCGAGFLLPRLRASLWLELLLGGLFLFCCIHELRLGSQCLSDALEAPCVAGRARTGRPLDTLLSLPGGAVLR